MLIPILLSFTLIFNSAVTVQRPDFTGTWNARIIRSDRDPVSALKISFREPKLEIVRMRTFRDPTIVMGQSLGTRSSNRFVFYTDGRGETQTSPLSGEINSTTERIGEKFVITSGSKSKGKLVADQTLTFEVSSDGKTLTETMTFFGGGNNRRIVHLYDRNGGNNSSDINGEWVQRVSNQIISLTIEHRDPEIKVTRREVSETKDETEVAVYYTDGRGETNTQHGQTVKSVTKWKDQTLVFSLSSKSKIGRDWFEQKETVKWQIAKDGGSLIQVSQSTMSASAGVVIPPPPSKLVFARN